jgi:hypothetical protein
MTKMKDVGQETSPPIHYGQSLWEQVVVLASNGFVPQQMLASFDGY